MICRRNVFAEKNASILGPTVRFPWWSCLNVEYGLLETPWLESSDRTTGWSPLVGHPKLVVCVKGIPAKMPEIIPTKHLALTRHLAILGSRKTRVTLACFSDTPRRRWSQWRSGCFHVSCWRTSPWLRKMQLLGVKNIWFFLADEIPNFFQTSHYTHIFDLYVTCVFSGCEFVVQILHLLDLWCFGIVQLSFF